MKTIANYNYNVIIINILLFLSKATFDVQNFLIDQNSNGQFCFQCIFVPGSSAFGCYIQYNNLIDDKNLIITRQNETTTCNITIASGNYNITIYDYETEDTIYTVRPAYQLMTSIPQDRTTFSMQPPCEQTESTQMDCIQTTTTITTDLQTSNNCIIQCTHIECKRTYKSF